jgi:hypothetical protein
VKLLTSPAPTALVALALAAGLHPASPALRWFHVAPVALPALSLLLVVSLAARARRDLGRWILLVGAIGILLALALDDVRGSRGTLALRAGEAQGSYDEQGTRGRSLGLRPFGFTVGLESASQTGMVLAFSGPSGETRHTISPERAAGYQGHRFGWRGMRVTGQAASPEVEAVELSVSREPAAWALGLATAAAAVGAALRKAES